MHQGDSKGAPDALKLSISAGNGLFVQAEVLLKYPTFGGFFHVFMGKGNTRFEWCLYLHPHWNFGFNLYFFCSTYAVRTQKFDFQRKGWLFGMYYLIVYGIPKITAYMYLDYQLFIKDQWHTNYHGNNYRNHVWHVMCHIQMQKAGHFFHCGDLQYIMNSCTIYSIGQ